MAKHAHIKHCRTAKIPLFKRREASTVAQAVSSDLNDSEKPKGPSHAKPIDIAKTNEYRIKIAKRVGIVTGATLGAFTLIYLIGVALFSFIFMPNTFLSKVDVSFKTPDQVRAELSDTVAGFKINVFGKGLNTTFSSEDTGLDIDVNAITDAIVASQNPWKWPVHVFRTRDMTSALAQTLTATKLGEVVAAAVGEVNATANPPQNATIKFNQKTASYDIVPEVQGTKLNGEAVLKEILLRTMELADDVSITDEMLVQPDVFRDDERVIKACENANKLIAAAIDLKLGETSVKNIDGSIINEWVVLQPDYSLVMNEEQMTSWASELASQFNTVGTARSFTRPDGKNVEVKGGDYGWSIDTKALVKAIVEGVNSGTKAPLEIPVLQKGRSFTLGSGRDWGTRYIDVDISQQHARFYGDDGSIIWESDVVTGAPTDGRSTPTGVYDLNLKGRNITLVGRTASGEIDYETPVSYWMPFKGNSVGFHDAKWQSAFGGSRYRSGSGSHGCVNLPPSKAAALYDIIGVGDVVVVHY